MTDKIDARLIQAAVLLGRQYRMLERLYEGGQSTLTNLEAAIDNKTNNIDHVFDVYNYVLALIDSFARYQKTAFSIPRLNQKDAEYRALETAMGDIKDARDQLQHLNNDIENDNTGPLLGGVVWARGNRSYIVALNDVGRDRSTPGIAYDTHEKRHVSDFCFTYGDKHYDLAKAFSGIQIFQAWVNRKVRIEIDGQPYEDEKHFISICAAFLTETEVQALQRDQQASLSAQTSGT